MNDHKETKKKVCIIYNKNDSPATSFTSYLSPTLNRQGISTVNVHTGSEVETSRFLYIKVFLVVLSSPYALSLADLENLVKLLEFLHRNGHVVVPVFYDTSASIMKQHVEMFGEAFAMLQKSYSVDQVTKWRRALVTTMELQGHEYNDEQRDESEFIEEIVEDVSEKLYPTERMGIHRILLELESLLYKQPWGFRSIGILGEPGIGKTTLAKAFFCRMYGGYDVYRFIIISDKKIVELLSNEDLKETPMEKFDLNNQDGEPYHRQKRILLVLDDVRNLQDAKYFLDGFGRFAPGSLLIITSRDREVLDECNVSEVYELKGLNNEDSVKLFTRCAYGEDVVEEKLPKLSVRDIKRCDGNPYRIRSYAEEIIKRNRSVYMELATDRSCHYNSIMYTKQRFRLFSQATASFSTTLKLSLLCTTSQNYQYDLEKLLGFNIAKCFSSDVMALDSDINLKHLSGLYLPSHALASLPSGRWNAHICPEYVLAYQLNKPCEEYKSFRDYASMENILVTNKLEPLQVLNLSGCMEIKHIPELVKTIKELQIEDQILQWRFETDPLCPLCNSANQTGSYVYFDFTYYWSIGTTISNRLNSLVNLTGSKTMKILSRMTWQLTSYSHWIKRNNALYRQSLRIDRFHRLIRYLTRLKKRKRRISFGICQLFLSTTSSH